MTIFRNIFVKKSTKFNKNWGLGGVSGWIIYYFFWLESVQLFIVVWFWKMYSGTIAIFYVFRGGHEIFWCAKIYLKVGGGALFLKVKYWCEH